MREDLEWRGRRLNWRQACEVLGCGRTHFFRLVETGQLPAYRLEGARRGLWVYEADCRRLIRPVDAEN